MGVSDVPLTECRPPRPPMPLGALAAQAGALAAVAAVLVLIVLSTAANLRARGIPLGLDFLVDPAGFSVAETVIPFGPGDSVMWAMGVGVGNTIYVSVLVSLASTILGLMLGVARLSDNPLVAGLARVWVEGARNTPPILMLIFIYTLWWQVLPSDRVLTLAPGVLASIRGLAIPAVTLPWSGASVWAGLALAAAGFAAAVLAVRHATADPRRRRLGFTVAAGLIAALAAGLSLRAGGGFGLALPRQDGLSMSGGAILTPELFTILFGLTLYTTGFVAEIVRGGINAVPRGQWEAARALGLGAPATLRLVIIPQMMRIVVPPMTSQYINVIKNSTLALAVGYTDFLTIMGTVINKTSHAVEGTLIIILVYLAINLSLSAVLNWYNRHVAIAER